LQPSGRASGPHQQLSPFVEDPLRSQPFWHDALTQLDSLRRNLKFEPSGELHRAQHSQRVLRELGGGVAQNARLQIRDPMKRVNDLPGFWIEGDRIQREIPAGSRFAITHVRIRKHVESPVAKASLRFPSRNGEVDFQPVQLQHPKRHAHFVHLETFRERLQQLTWC
jgi:hypothetical protein